jgi:hypothetical protein
MTETITTPCARGCVTEASEGANTPDAMPAVHGPFCARCYSNVKRALAVAPPLIELLITRIPRGVSAELQEVIVDRSKGAAPAPLDVNAATDADTLYAKLVSFAAVWAKKMNVQAPGPAARAWRNETQRVVGLPAGITHEQGRYEAGVMAKWLSMHLDEIFGLKTPADDIVYFTEDMAEVFKIAKRWPVTTQPRYVPAPHTCGGRIAVYPAQSKGASTTIVCDTCHENFDEDALAEYVQGYADNLKAEAKTRKREAQRAAREANKTEHLVAHLVRKHGFAL